jgi:hypothetical protein
MGEGWEREMDRRVTGKGLERNRSGTGERRENNGTGMG